MTSPQHAKWIRSGLQWQLAWPLVALRDRLRGYGYTVYDLGDTRHLDHEPPEDHTPYSETGWPGTTPYGWVTAIDIMPPPSSALPSLQQLGAQMYADRQAGVPGIAWLKYMNWGPVNNRSAVQDRWMPSHVRRSSSDVGHGHLSGRSDHVLVATEAELNYDPVARLRGQTTTSGGDGTVAFYRTPDGNVYNENGALVFASEFPDSVASRIALVPAASLERVLQLTGARSALDPAALKSALVDALDAALPDVATADVTAALEAALQAPAVHGVLVDTAEEGSNRAEDS